MRVAATCNTKTFVRPLPLQARIAELIHQIKALAASASTVKITLDSIITVAMIVLISYAAVKFNEQRIASSYIDQTYKIVLHPDH